MSTDTRAVKLTAAQRKQVAIEVAKHLAEAKKTLVEVDSKPEHVAALESVWRKSKEHYKAQVLRFLGIFAALIGNQLFQDFVGGKHLFEGLTTPRSIFAYLVGFAFLAYKQYKPSMSASAADSAPGVTIVPEQVGAATQPEVVVGVEQVPEGDAAP